MSGDADGYAGEYDEVYDEPAWEDDANGLPDAAPYTGKYVVEN